MASLRAGGEGLQRRMHTPDLVAHRYNRREETDGAGEIGGVPSASTAPGASATARCLILLPDHLKTNPDLWSGCISGAFQEQAFLQAFVDAGFRAVSYDKWEAEAWQVVEGVEFRSVTLTAVRGEGTECLDVGHAVIYRGPFMEVCDEEGHTFPRGERMAVCERTFRFLIAVPMADHFIGIQPQTAREPLAWYAPPGTRRSAAETKGAVHVARDCGPACC